MSQYATIADLTALGLPSAALVGVSTADTDAALVAASGRADGYLAKQYALPLSVWGADLTRAVAQIAAWDLITTRGTRPGDQAAMLERRYDDAIQWLRDVSRGIVEPQGVVDATPAAAETSPVVGGGVSSFSVSDDGTVWT